MRRFMRWLFALLLVALIAGVIFLRVKRHSFEPAQPVRASVVRLRNSFVDLYGAKSGDRVILFDAGVDNEGKAVDALLAALGATRDSVSDVFLTHAHGDHVGAVPLLPHALVHAGQADVELAAGTKPQGSLFARPLAWILPAPKVTVTDALVGRREISVGGGETVVALPFPGHTNGSYMYLYQGVLFTGDALNLDGGKLVPPPSLFSSSASENRKSIASLGAELGGAKVEIVCTGHGGCTTPADTTDVTPHWTVRAR